MPVTARPGTASVAWAVLEAPSVLGLFPGGVEFLPEALLGAGLAERLGAVTAGRVEPPAWDPRRDPVTGLVNGPAIARYARLLADRIGDVRRGGRVPLVLGGDCSNVLGCLLALRRAGRAGLLFLDGHADFYQPEAEPTGEVASMDLALATGRGPGVLADLEGLGPLVRDDDVVVVLGRRDAHEADAHGSRRIEDTPVTVIDLDAVRTAGAAEAAADAVARLAGAHLDGLWVHLDADVLDDAVMPAVDYRLPGGLGWDELATVLSTALASGRVLGVDVAILNPSLDPDGSVTRAFVDTLVHGLG